MTKRLARARRAASRLLVFGPGLAVLGADWTLRGKLLRELTRPAALGYAAWAWAATVTWGALVVASARRRGASRWVGRVALAALALFAVGTELQSWARYHAYLNWRTALMGNSLWPSLAQQAWGDRAEALAWLLGPAAVALGIAAGARRLAPPRRWAARLALPVAGIALASVVGFARPDEGWDSGTTPDALWLAAQGALARSLWTGEDVMVTLRWLPASRSARAVPPLEARPAARRSVLLLLDESVRAEGACAAPAPGGCEETPFTNAELPARFGLTQMRALDSTTALSMTALLTGHGPASPRAELLSAPLLFEVAHAAGIETGFWTSQNLLYANAGRFLDGTPLRFFCTGTDLEPYADYLDGADDAALLDRVTADLARLKEPFFGVVQLANTHFPYKIDERDLPFSSTRDWKHMDAFGRTAVRYADAVHRQDKFVARFVRSLPRADTVVFFVSDHGEQLGEHGRTGHTWTEYDFEIHVPAWVVAPLGALTDAEAGHLREARDAPVTMLDVAPTLLDLMGLWDAPGFGKERASMEGVSLLRGLPPAARAVVMTNCSPLFWCSSRNWGAMRGSLKLFAEGTDADWRCFDVATDPREQRDLGPAACGDLRALAEAGGRGTPF